MRFWRNINIELIAWLGGLAYLALINPDRPHFSFCLFYLLGIEFCPGCGLGRSVSYLLHGEIAKSWETHILGIFAFIVLVLRIIQLIRINNGKCISTSAGAGRR
jgi:hypothetical protein